MPRRDMGDVEVHFHELLPVPLNGIECPDLCCSSLRQTTGHTLHVVQSISEHGEENGCRQ